MTLKEWMKANGYGSIPEFGGTENFSQAFRMARQSLGDGGYFTYKGKVYTTDLASSVPKSGKLMDKLTGVPSSSETVNTTKTPKSSQTMSADEMYSSHFNTAVVDNAKNFEEGTNPYEAMATDFGKVMVDPFLMISGASEAGSLLKGALSGAIKQGRSLAPKIALENPYLRLLEGQSFNGAEFDTYSNAKKALEAFKNVKNFDWSHQAIGTRMF